MLLGEIPKTVHSLICKTPRVYFGTPCGRCDLAARVESSGLPTVKNLLPTLLPICSSTYLPFYLSTSTFLLNVLDKRVGQICKLAAFYASTSVLTLQPTCLHQNPLNQVILKAEIALAIEAFKQGYFRSTRDTAKSYDVPRATLQYRLKGHPTQ
jgi:hypothetical protein